MSDSAVGPGNDRDKHSFLERVPDVWKSSGRGRIAAGPFLTPGEVPDVTAALHRCGAEPQRFLFFGGYREAERVRLYCLPDYVEREEGDLPMLLSVLAEDEDCGIAVLQIRGSGYRTLTHRDFLGAVLGLGLERDALGDLLVTDGHTARLFCTPTVAAFLSDMLVSVGNDTVTVERLAYDGDYTPERHFVEINDTVASARLDGVVAALCRLSREDAQKAVTAGRVEYNYRPAGKPDMPVTPPAIVTVHGAGKYKIVEIGDPNRRGRLRLHALKYD